MRTGTRRMLWAVALWLGGVLAATLVWAIVRGATLLLVP
ncbi:hypothetical protein WG78_20615 [Amantichitinum ursilacus]|uniref:DUF2474 domain-containing protein n=1 Tax=Amantichitinum ursilacus TaxID=857265 RepID=A0A0N0GKW6_9NEIS|nr:hypothetical protein WG78_20615 [Amantichitinum ursilacus]